MKVIFVDTSAWYAIQDKSDANHKIAVGFVKKSILGKYQLITTNFVLDETYTLLLDRIGYDSVIQFKHSIDIMLNSRMLVVTRISEFIEEDAWEVFERFNLDKKWSYTDCTSKVVMEQRKILEAFAFDHHFEQMGFIRKP